MKVAQIREYFKVDYLKYNKSEIFCYVNDCFTVISKTNDFNIANLSKKLYKKIFYSTEFRNTMECIYDD